MFAKKKKVRFAILVVPKTMILRLLGGLGLHGGRATIEPEQK